MALKAQMPKRELPFANAMQQFNAGERDGRTIEMLKTEHRADARFHAAMILFDNVIEVFR